MEASVTNRTPASGTPEWLRDILLSIVLGVGLAAVAFGAGGGLRLAPETAVEMAMTLLGAVVVAALALFMPSDRRRYGTASLLLFAAFSTLTVLSIAWATQPTDAWLEANRVVSYLAIFAATISCVRVAPIRWRSVIGGIAVATLILSVYALATKVFPGSLNPDETFARLREPFGYWNAVGLMAALGIPACLWLGTRRRSPLFMHAAAYPALGLLFVAVMFSFSRGAILAALLGIVFWFVAARRPLRGFALLAIAALGASVVTAWSFSHDELTQDRIALAERTAAGHDLGWLLLAMTVALLLAGVAIDVIKTRRPLTESGRHRAGAAIVALICVAILVALGAVTFAGKGLSGNVSSAWHSLTSDDASTPKNDPSRLTATASVRARYWREAVEIWQEHKLVGVGAGGYATARTRFRKGSLEVRHAHGFLAQTLSDLGLAGLLLSLALLITVIVAAVRPIRLSKQLRSGAVEDERLGMLTLGATALIFATHSFIDWTWYVTGTATIGLLCAGWLVGRGPLVDGRGRPTAHSMYLGTLRNVDALRVIYAVLALAAGVAAAWAIWQPLRSTNAGERSLELLEQHNTEAALEEARRAHSLNPLSVEPYFELAAIETESGHRELASNTLENAVKLQPSNPQTWERLADYQLNQLKQPLLAYKTLQGALYLDPRSAYVQTAFLLARDQVKTQAAKQQKERRRRAQLRQGR